MKFDFHTLILRLAEISGCHSYTYPLRACQISGENVIALLIEEIDITIQQTVPKTKLDTEVILMGALPRHPVVRILTLVNARRAGISEIIVVVYLAPLLFIEETLCHSVHGVHIITHFTVACTNLQIVQPLFGACHEFLFRHTPSKGESGEETEASAFHEVFRTIVSRIEFHQILIGIRIGDTAHKTLITFGQF